MKKKIILLVLSIMLMVGKVDGATLTQKLGNEYISTTIQAGKMVNMSFTSKIGFQFNKWQVEQGSIGITPTDASISFTMPDSNVTIRGIYDATYTITFNSNGGQGSMTSQIIPAGATRELAENTFTKGGILFEGWSTEANGSVEYTDKASIKPTENMTLYAVWKETRINEIPVGAYIKYVPEARTVTALGSDTGTGYNQDFNTGTYDDGWKVMYNNDGQLDIISAESVIDVNNGLVIGVDTGGEEVRDDTELANKAKIGYAQSVYTLNKFCSAYGTGEFAYGARSVLGNGGGEENLFNCTIDGQALTIDDISHTRMRELIDAGKVTEENMLYPYMNIVDLASVEAEVMLVFSPELVHTEGYIWMAYRYAELLVSVGSNFGVNCVDPSDGGGCYFREDSDGVFFCNGVPAGVRPVVSLSDGLKVVGGSGTKEDPYVLGKDTSYIEPYTVSYNANGGSEAPVKQKKIPNVALKLSNVVPVRNGYEFLGWAESSSATSPDYVAGGSFTANKNITLYAVWKVSTASIIPMNKIPVGAYIKYTPEARTVTASGSDTGTGYNQDFNTGTYNKGWKVMYNNYGQLDIISAESVIDGLVIGVDTGGEAIYGDEELANKAKIGYAKSVYTLNKFCSAYGTGEFAVSGRSFGSAGTAVGDENLFNCTIDGENLTIDDISYSTLRELVNDGTVAWYDDLYGFTEVAGYPYTSITDFNTAFTEIMSVMTPELIHTEGFVWVAYRIADLGTGSGFGVGCMNPSGGLGNGGCHFAEDVLFDTGGIDLSCFGIPAGVRPVVTLQSGLRVVSGDGLTPETAYVLSY